MGIDWWTLGLQAVNVAILVWLLAKVLWRPVAQMIADRQAAAARLLDDAAASRTAAEAELAQTKAAREGIDAERQTLLAEARKAAEAERQALLDRARSEAEALAKAAAAARGADAAAAQAAYAAKAGDLAFGIAARLGRSLAGPALEAAYLDRLTSRIAALTDTERAILSQAEGVEVASATPPDDSLRQHLAGPLGETVFTLAHRPELICGLSLTAPHLQVTCSWSGDLDHLRREVSDVAV